MLRGCCRSYRYQGTDRASDVRPAVEHRDVSTTSPAGPTRVDGRWLAAAMVAMYFGGLLVASYHTNYVRVWAELGVGHMSPRFADLRVITAGVETARAGGNPLVANTRDSWGRPMNYPRIWLALGAFGVTQRQTTALASILLAGFYLSVYRLMGKITMSEGAIYGVLLCSPAVMLGVERANIDLLVFALLVFATELVGSRRTQMGAYVTAFACAMLKLYPICAFALALREPTWRRAGAILGAASLGFALYLALIFRDVKAIIAGTPHVKDLSYGCDVLFKQLQAMGYSLNPMYWGLAAVALVTIVTAVLALKGKAPDRRMMLNDCALVGSAIYAGTFVFLSSFNYRLVFLLLLIPQLLLWCRSRSFLRWVAAAGVTTTAYAFWMSAPRDAVQFISKECANWLMFALSAYLLWLRLRLSLELWRGGTPVNAPVMVAS